MAFEDKGKDAKTPTELWDGYLEDHDGHDVSLRFMGRTIIPALTKLGYEVSTRASLPDTLTAGLEPLEIGPGPEGHQSHRCSFPHFLNLLWQPLITFVEALGEDVGTPWTDCLALHQNAILSEMHGILGSADESLDMDTWVEFIRKTLVRLLQVDVPSRLILQVLSPIVPFDLAAHTGNCLSPLEIIMVFAVGGAYIGCSGKSDDPC